MGRAVAAAEAFGRRARARRWAEFSRRFPDLANMKVLDLGGTAAFWRAVPTRPAHVTTVNLDPVWGGIDDGWLVGLTGDATQADSLGRFDLVVSNSLIEHVGGHAMRSQLAETIREVADRHWVQTPYRYFPIEPHWVAPGMQHLPFPARRAIARRWPPGRRQRNPDPHQAALRVAEIELLTITEMRMYFPDSQLWIERLAGVPKSLTAVQAT